MLGFAISGWTRENYTKLMAIYDAEGFGCGIKNQSNPDYVNYPYGYFVSPDY